MTMKRRALFAVTLVMLACGGDSGQRAGEQGAHPAAAVELPSSSRSLAGARDDDGRSRSVPGESATAESATAAPLVIFLGDSLTAGFGLAEDEAYPALIAQELARRGQAARVINAGVSGDTTAGGLARLSWLLGQRPDILVVALGANDGLRGLPLAATEENLRQILSAAKAAKTPVLLAGMLLPPNYGPEYTAEFAALFRRLAQEFGVAFHPFLLEGVAGRPELNQADGIHPNAAGQHRVATQLLTRLDPLLREIGDSGSRASAPTLP